MAPLAPGYVCEGAIEAEEGRTQKSYIRRSLSQLMKYHIF